MPKLPKAAEGNKLGRQLITWLLHDHNADGTHKKPKPKTERKKKMAMTDHQKERTLMVVSRAEVIKTVGTSFNVSLVLEMMTVLAAIQPPSQGICIRPIFCVRPKPPLSYAAERLKKFATDGEFRILRRRPIFASENFFSAIL